MQALEEHAIQRAAALARDPAALAAELARVEPLARQSPGAVRVVRAPGRVNLIGEHTDYNDGLVLPVAIDLGIALALIPTDDRRVELTTLGTGERGVVDLDAIRGRDGTWLDYVAGVAWALTEAGAPIRGFRGVIAADLPAGAGLSSSAALELAAAWALAGGAAPVTDSLDLARIAQRAENAFVGVPSGLMDQFAVTFGRPGAALLLDCRTLEHRPVTIPPALELVVCFSGLPRRLAGSAYADRRADCARAVAQIRTVNPAVESLRDVDGSLLGEARPAMDDVAYRRARHVVTENARVADAVRALEAGDAARLGAALAGSHASLRDDFEVSRPELDRLVEVAASTPGVVGARLTGAGFGGCTISVVEPSAVDTLVERLAALPRFLGGAPIRAFGVVPSGGAGLVWPREAGA